MGGYDTEHEIQDSACVYDVTCARCGKVLSVLDAVPEEGDEWECVPCNDRCNAQERAELGIYETNRGQHVIVHKSWLKSYDKGVRRYRERWEGWFLFGIIPLYMVRHERSSEIR